MSRPVCSARRTSRLPAGGSLRTGALLPWRRVALVGLVCYVTVSLVSYLQLTRDQGGAPDFFTPWLASRAFLVEGLDPYSDEVTARSQHAILGRAAETGEDQLAFAYPLPVVILLAPFALLPYPVAQAAWTGGLLLGTCLLSRAWIRRRLSSFGLVGLFLWTIGFYPIARSLILGQIALASTLLFGLGVLLLLRPPTAERRREILAGVALAFALVKPQLMFLAVPLVILRAWRDGQRAAVVVWGATSLSLLGVSLLLAPGWIGRWIQRVAEYAAYVKAPAIIATLLPPAWLHLPAALAGLSIALWASWRRLRAPVADFLPTLWLVLAVTLLVTPRSTASDQALLALPFLHWIDLYPRWAPAGAAIVAIGLWILFLVFLSSAGESWLLRLPLPIVTLAILVYQEVRS